MQNTWLVSNKKFEEHTNDAAKHGLGVLDYTNGVLVEVSELTEQNPFVAPFAGELVGVFEPRAHSATAYAVINGNKTAYRSSTSSDYSLNRDCFSIKLYTGDKLYFTSQVGGDAHYFYPYVNQKIVNLTGDDVVSNETFNAHVSDTNLHYSGLPNVIESGSNDNGFYRKWSNGDLEQYGSSDGTRNGNLLTIDFPIAFASTQYCVNFTPLGPPSETGTRYNRYVYEKALDYVVFCDHMFGLGVTRCDWHAIGKWK